MARAFLVVAFTLAGVLPVLADDSSISDYVQDGLVAHWDAIDNTGTGHDDAATAWTDLKGGREFNMFAGHYTWYPNSVYFDGQSGTGGNCSDDGLFVCADEGAVRTVEIVFEFPSTMTAYSGGALLVGPIGSKIAIARRGAASAPVGLVASENEMPTLSPTCMQGLNTISFGYRKDGDSIVPVTDALHLNARAVMPAGANLAANSYPSGSYVNLGRDNNGGNRFAGHVYSIRVYNRLLTQAEREANQLVDSRRFRELRTHEFYVDANNGVDDEAHDGTEPAKAKKTLAEIFKIANQRGDVVWAMPGTYDKGEATDATESTKYTQVNRCVIPADVTLKSTQGAAVTFIKGRKTAGATAGVGADSIRGVRMMTGAILDGFTVCDSSTAGSASGGGVKASPCCVIKDCVIRNNGAVEGGGFAQSVNEPHQCCFLLRCEVAYNESTLTYQGSAFGGSSYVVVNSWIHGNTYTCAYPGGGGTSFLNTTLDDRLRIASGASAYGCYFSSDTSNFDTADTTDLYDSLFASQSDYDSQTAKGLVKRGCSVGTTTVDAYDNVLYGQSFRDVFPEYTAEAGLAFGGLPRISNRIVDFGGREYDWRPVYAADLAPQRVAVAAATPGVCETANKKVALTDGDELVVDWTAPFEGANEYDMRVQVTGTGVLSVCLAGESAPFATVSADDGETTVVKTVEGSPSFRLAFAGDGEAQLWNFSDTTAVRVDLPQGGVKVTGVAVGEEVVVKPGEPVTIKLERTYDSPRLCTGFTVNGVTFVNFDDYPDGWTHTVSDRASAVSIVAQYKTVQDFYVDPVNGNDANCGFQTNRAWKTLATIATNGNVCAGDIVYAFPGTHAEGSVPRTEGDTTLNRVIVPAGVKLLALTDHGAKDTFICGATAPEADANGQGDGAVRCAFLEDGAEIRGFTLMGGHTATEVAGTPSPNNSYAAVGTDYQNNDPVCAVVDCVISNNIAQWKCVGGPAYYIRCRMTENRGLSWNSGVEGAWLYNCFAKDNKGTYWVMSPKDFVNCTFLSGAEVRNPNEYADLRNSVIYALTGCTVYNCVYGSCNLSTRNVESSRQVDFETLTFDEEGRCTAEVLRDFGLNEYLDPVPEEFRGVDKDGVQRVYNGAVDVGAYEYDKRGDFAADLGRRFAVDAATPGVTEVESSVRLDDGDALTLGWKPGRQPAPFALPFAVTGGTLTVKVNGAVVATFDADGEWRVTDAADVETVEISFAASAAGGNAVLTRSVSLSGLVLIVR